MSQERLETELQSKFTVGHRDESTVASVTIEEHQLASPCRRNASSDVLENREHRARREPDRAGVPSVFIALGVRERWKEPSVDTGVHGTRHRGLGDGRCDGQIGVEGQMGPVLLDRSERLDDHRLRGESTGDIGTP